MQIKFAIPGRAQQYKFPQQGWPHRAAMQSTIPKTAFERRGCTKRKFPRRRKVHWTARPDSASHTRETHKYAQPQVTGHTPPCIGRFLRLSTSCFLASPLCPLAHESGPLDCADTIWEGRGSVESLSAVIEGAFNAVHLVAPSPGKRKSAHQHKNMNYTKMIGSAVGK